MKSKKTSHLLGVAFDGDGEKRVTSSEDFSIVGGTEETHDAMSETAFKTFEDLKKRGKNLDNVEPQELRDIIEKNTPRK